MSRRAGRKRGSKAHRPARIRKFDTDPRETKRVRFQSPPSAGSADEDHTGLDLKNVDDQEYGLSISSAGNRFNLLQGTSSLLEVILGESSDSETDEADACIQGEDRDLGLPITLDRNPLTLPEDVLGEGSESGSSATEGHPDLLSNVSGGRRGLLPSEVVHGQGNEDPGMWAALPVDPVGEASDCSDEERRGSLEEARRSNDISELSVRDVPKVIVQPASSPVRTGEMTVPHLGLERLFGVPHHFDSRNDSASPPLSSGAPTSWNTPSSAADASLPPLSPLFGMNHAEELTPEDRATRLGIEDELVRAFAEKAAIEAEIASISTAETVAQEMQQMSLPSLPKYWNAYQYGLSLRGHQARSIWSRMAGLGEGGRMEG